MGPRPAHPLLPAAKAQASPPPQRLPPPPAPALSDELPWGDLSLNKCLVLASFVALLGSAFQLCRGEPGRRPSPGSSRAPKGWAGTSPPEAGCLLYLTPPSGGSPSPWHGLCEGSSVPQAPHLVHPRSATDLAGPPSVLARGESASSSGGPSSPRLYLSTPVSSVGEQVLAPQDWPYEPPLGGMCQGAPTAHGGTGPALLQLARGRGGGKGALQPRRSGGQTGLQGGGLGGGFGLQLPPPRLG